MLFCSVFHDDPDETSWSDKKVVLYIASVNEVDVRGWSMTRDIVNGVTPETEAVTEASVVAFLKPQKMNPFPQ